MKLRLSFLGIILVALAFTTGCGNKSDDPIDRPAPHTGNPAIEKDKAPESEISFRFFGDTTAIYYVVCGRLNVRSTPEIREDNMLGALTLNVRSKTPFGAHASA